jgi:hypothetical protein
MKKVTIILFVFIQGFFSFAQTEYSLFEYYPFNGNAYDESGNGMDGIIYGSTTDFEEGMNELSISFHNTNPDPFAVNDYVELPNLTINDFTVSHWFLFRSDASPEYEAATYSFGKMHPDTCFYINILPTGHIRACIVSKFGGSYLQWIEAGTFYVGDNQWYHVAVSVGDGYMILYINGDSIDAAPISFDPVFVNAPQFVSLHAWEEGEYRSSRFNGNIDYLMIFNRVLSKAEVQLIYYVGVITSNESSYNLVTDFSKYLIFNNFIYGDFNDKRIQVYNLNGDLVYERLSCSKIQMISLPPGIFLLVIFDKQKNILIKRKFLII